MFFQCLHVYVLIWAGSRVRGHAICWFRWKQCWFTSVYLLYVIINDVVVAFQDFVPVISAVSSWHTCVCARVLYRMSPVYRVRMHYCVTIDIVTVRIRYGLTKTGVCEPPLYPYPLTPRVTPALIICNRQNNSVSGATCLLSFQFSCMKFYYHLPD